MATRASPQYNLQVVNPILAREWHPTKNGNLSPINVTPRSGRRVWWKCKLGHEWQTDIGTRNTQRTGCPYCSGRLASDGNSLAEVLPDLAKEWHPTKNGSLSPYNTTSKSSKKVWWKCERGHEWEAKVANRSIGGRACPYCGHKKLHSDNCLEQTHPALAKEWHPTKNGYLKPNEVFAGSARKIWWKCKRGHEWQASLNSRSSRTETRGCPQCHSATSVMELRVFSELRALFPNVKHRERIKGFESDIYLPDFKFAIEVDGAYWHQNKEQKDIEKTKFLNEQGIFLLRLREGKLKKLSEYDIQYIYGKDDHDPKLIQKILKVLLLKRAVDNSISTKIEEYISVGRLANDQEFNKLYSSLPNPLLGKSLGEIDQLASSRWHPTKNGDLTPFNVYPRSHKRVWWKCQRGHEWEAPINSQRGNKGCPYCANRLVSKDNCLALVNPSLAKEWHPTKNGDLTPYKVIAGTPRSVWWVCSEGHEWKTAVVNRSNGTGCPYCTNRMVHPDRNLQVKKPKIASEWHPLKNGTLTPNMVLPSSHKRVWWLCSKGHEWIASVARRRGCPECARIKRGISSRLTKLVTSGSLKIINPNLAAQWHPTKNGDSTPDKIAPKSNKRVWWLCKKGHEWLTSPANRSRGTGCPECSISRGAEATRLKKLKASGSLQQIDPQLAKEWHSKNGHLTADKVSPYSNKKVWWLCPKGHEWVASVADRSTNGACPFCNKKRPSIDYCLETMRPELAKEWHPNKNGILTPSQITVASNKKVWWKCSNGHEWLSSVANRSKGRGCPQCSKRVASSDYSLAKGNEKLAKEWHSSQNSPLTPKDVTPFSHRKVWWTCPKGHDYVASIAKRSIGRGCPYCAGKKAWIKLE